MKIAVPVNDLLRVPGFPSREACDRLHAAGKVSRFEGPNGLVGFKYVDNLPGEAWADDDLRACRGIVFDGVTPVSYPFPKFFTVQETGTVAELPEHWAWSDVSITEKLDGSMIQIFRHEGVLQVTTPGSFASPQAQRAAEILHARFPNLAAQLAEQGVMTLLCELIDPVSTVAVDYGRESNVYVIGARWESGVMLTTSELRSLSEEIRMSMTADYGHTFPSYSELLRELRESPTVREGVVLLHEPSGERLKVKTTAYWQLAKIVADLHPNRVLEQIPEGRGSTAEEVMAIADRYLSDLFAKKVPESHRARGLAFVSAVKVEAARIMELESDALEFLGSFEGTQKELAEVLRERGSEFRQITFALRGRKAPRFPRSSWARGVK